jgi:type IV secretory pathway TrbD component
MSGCLDIMIKFIIGFLVIIVILWMLPIIIWIIFGYVCWIIGTYLYESLRENPKDLR